MPHRLAVLALIGGVVLFPDLLASQGKLPRRPRLGDAADTNDARAYYGRGIALLDRSPAQAADAFYWATRLDPGFAEAWYARRVAGFIADERLLVRYVEGQRAAVRSRDAQQLDSLEYRAQKINPFFLRDLDRPFLARYVAAAITEELRRSGGRPLDESERHELDFYVDGYLQRGTNLRVRGTLAASQRDFDGALDLYRRALDGSRDRAGIFVDRARVFFVTGVPDSALVQLREAIEELRRQEGDRLQRVYESREFFEHCAALIHEQQGDRAAARDAYGRALQENLSYYPAHVGLGLLALAAGDTATGLSELELATQVAPGEPAPRLTFAALLAQVGRHDDAEAQLRQVAELEPYYALPHYLLGRLGEVRRNRDQALAGYTAYLARAGKLDRLRADVERRVADLQP